VSAKKSLFQRQGLCFDSFTWTWFPFHCVWLESFLLVETWVNFEIWRLMFLVWLRWEWFSWIHMFMLCLSQYFSFQRTKWIYFVARHHKHSSNFFSQQWDFLCDSLVYLGACWWEFVVNWMIYFLFIISVSLNGSWVVLSISRVVLILQNQLV